MSVSPFPVGYFGTLWSSDGLRKLPLIVIFLVMSLAVMFFPALCISEMKLEMSNLLLLFSTEYLISNIAFSPLEVPLHVFSVLPR